MYNTEKGRLGKARIITGESYIDIDIFSKVERPTTEQYRFTSNGGDIVTVPAERTILYIFDKKS